MLSLFSKHIKKYHIGQYRDNGLSILKKPSGPEEENLRKSSNNYLQKKMQTLLFNVT